MKKQIATTILFVFAISLAPVAFSADGATALKECKSEAEKNEVEAADMNTFLTNCMAELDVAAADIQALLKPEIEGTEQPKDE